MGLTVEKSHRFRLAARWAWGSRNRSPGLTLVFERQIIGAVGSARRIGPEGSRISRPKKVAIRPQAENSHHNKQQSEKLP
jgi:hypothetical protein